MRYSGSLLLDDNFVLGRLCWLGNQSCCVGKRVSWVWQHLEKVVVVLCLRLLHVIIRSMQGKRGRGLFAVFVACLGLVWFSLLGRALVFVVLVFVFVFILSSSSAG